MFLLPATLLGLSFLSILTFPFFLRNPEYSTYMDVIHVHDAYLEIFHVQVRFFTSMYLCELRSNYVQNTFNYVQLRSNYVQLRFVLYQKPSSVNHVPDDYCSPDA